MMLGLLSLSEQIVLTRHARMRRAERFPELDEADVVGEIRAALRDGRCGAQRPDWLHPSLNRSALYAWTEEHERTYALVGEPDRWVVKTILLPKEIYA